MGNSGTVVSTPIGEMPVDRDGSAIGAARVDPASAYQKTPQLLKQVIDEGSQAAWAEIRARIDRTFEGLSHALEALDAEVSFSRELKRRIDGGQELFFKPNIVVPSTIDQVTHGPGNLGVCTPWEFVAALMRWFHDALGISYHQMSLGEAGSAMSVAAGTATRSLGRTVTTQALLEGKCGDFYGGWGFYFARRYLADAHDAGHSDDPMSGYEESLAGVCLPPGKARDKLMVYDINKIADDRSDGRDVPVARGINFTTITLHKVIVGGDPADAEDRANWPGCVLVNVPKLKIHQIELITNAVKNLGIGLYPMEVNDSDQPGKLRWKYAAPDRPMPTLKTRIPHTRWVGESDESTGMPLRDGSGQYVATRTGGIEATMADVIEAVQEQDIMMLHVVDAIEATNVSHAGPGFKVVPEGLILASTDPVAVDVLSARYLFSTVPMERARRLQRELRLPADIIQKVPLPRIEGQNIVTGEGYDSPFSRYHAFQHCQERGLGQQQFYVVGRDDWQGGTLASVEQHLGRVEGGSFTELLTGEMYFAQLKPLWDLQATCFAYVQANDRLTGSDFMKLLLDAYDENGDGVIDYAERGKAVGYGLMLYGGRLAALDIPREEMLRLRFLLAAVPLRALKREWNADGHDFGEHTRITSALMTALAMCWAPEESPDLFFPGMTWGKGKWPSLQYAMDRQLRSRVYGMGYPAHFDVLMAPYGLAFRYADLRWNGGRYAGAVPEARLLQAASSDDVIAKYHADVARGQAPLPFTFYVPRGLGGSGNGCHPNVEETDDPALMFSASFNGGEEVWRDLVPSSIP